MRKNKLIAVLSAMAMALTVLGCKTDTETEWKDKTYCAAVTFASEATEDGVKVTMKTATEDAKIYYTTDGTVPTAESTEYAEPVEFKADATLKAIAIKAGIENSPVSVAVVSIKEKTVEIPVPAGTYTVYHLKQDTAGGISPDSYSTVSAETEEGKDIPEGSGLSDVSKEFEGFTAVSLVVNQDSNDSSRQAVYVYYNRNTITYTFKAEFDDGTTSKEVSGLYGAFVAKPAVKTLVSAEGKTFKKWMLEDGSAAPLVYGAKDSDIIAVWGSDLEDFVEVTGGTVTGNTPHSDAFAFYNGVFITGRTVTLSGFYMSKYEVTQDEYSDFMGGQKVTVDGTEYTLNANPSYCTEANKSDYGVEFGEEQGKRPVEGVSWYDAVWYCNVRSEAEGLTPAYSITVTTVSSSGNITAAEVTFDKDADGYRLPTEAEWEYAARGGNTTATDWDYTFSGADTADDKSYSSSDNSGLDAVGWYNYNNDTGTTGSSRVTGNSNPSGRGTHQVGQKAANALGIYDMSGNVKEWCYDWYNSTVSTGSETDPAGALTGTLRVERGGSWGSDAVFALVCYRNYNTPSSRGGSLGFRLVRSAQ